MMNVFSQFYRQSQFEQQNEVWWAAPCAGSDWTWSGFVADSVFLVEDVFVRAGSLSLNLFVHYCLIQLIYNVF